LSRPPAADADSLRLAAMADAYISSPLLEQNRFLLRLDDEGVAQAVAQLRPTLSFVASANRDLVNDTTTGPPARGRMGALCRQQPPACDRGCARDREGRAAGPRVGGTAGAARCGHGLPQRLARPAGRRCARGQCPRRDPTAARRPRPLRGRRGHPHRRRPGRGAAGAGTLRNLPPRMGSSRSAASSFALAVGRHPGAMSVPGALARPAPQRGRGRRACPPERAVDPAPPA
jgi:hypothetical protein